MASFWTVPGDGGVGGGGGGVVRKVRIGPAYCNMA